MMPRRIFLTLALLLALAPPVAAQEIRPFVSGSIKEITAARQGKPFILGMWSLTCTHCREELSLLSGMAKKYPNLDLVLVATDTPEENEGISATLSQFGLGRAQAWVFADPFAERLRFEIDRKWHGELPRTYFYDSAHTVTATSGKLDRQKLEQWVSEVIGPQPQIAPKKRDGRVDKRSASTFGGGDGGCATLIHPTESMSCMVFLESQYFGRS